MQGRCWCGCGVRFPLFFFKNMGSPFRKHMLHTNNPLTRTRKKNPQSGLWDSHIESAHKVRGICAMRQTVKKESAPQKWMVDGDWAAQKIQELQARADIAEGRARKWRPATLLIQFNDMRSATRNTLQTPTCRDRVQLLEDTLDAWRQKRAKLTHCILCRGEL